MVFEAYFDESERDMSVFAVGGYLFTPEQARCFCREWQQMLGLAGVNCFHMTDLNAGRGEFEGFTPADKDRMLRDAVSIINRHTTSLVLVTCESQDFQVVAPKTPSHHSKNRRRSPYAVICHYCMFLTSMISDRRQEGVAYFFENGNQYQGEADRLLQAAVSYGYDHHYHYKSHTFIKRADAPPLQAADFLVWEATKCHKRETPRASFQALTQRDGNTIARQHLNRQQVEQIYKGSPWLKLL